MSETADNREYLDQKSQIVTICTILKIKITHGGVLLLLKLPANSKIVTLLYGCFSRFLNCTNGPKSCKASLHKV